MKGCFPSKGILKYSKKSKEMLAIYAMVSLPPSFGVLRFKSYHIAETGLKLAILLPQLSEYTCLQAQNLKSLLTFYYILLIN